MSVGDFLAVDLDGDRLEVGEATSYQRAHYQAVLAVVVNRMGMLLDRQQVIHLRDYLDEQLER